MRVLPEVEENDEGLRNLIRSLIEPGFLGVEEVLEIVEEWAEDAGLPAADVEASVTELWRERLAREKNWITPSDYDRLAAAFADLEAQGIVARMNFACCTNCATDEIGFERTERPNPSDGYRYNEWAYTYFHAQDTDRLVGEPPVVLWLGYSAFRSSPEYAGLEDRKYRTDLDVGRLVVSALRAHGLDAIEPETPDDRIAVTITDWRKPVLDFDEDDLDEPVPVVVTASAAKIADVTNQLLTIPWSAETTSEIDGIQVELTEYAHSILLADTDDVTAVTTLVADVETELQKRWPGIAPQEFDASCEFDPEDARGAFAVALNNWGLDKVEYRLVAERAVIMHTTEQGDFAVQALLMVARRALVSSRLDLRHLAAFSTTETFLRDYDPAPNSRFQTDRDNAALGAQHNPDPDARRAITERLVADGAVVCPTCAPTLVLNGDRPPHNVDYVATIDALQAQVDAGRLRQVDGDVPLGDMLDLVAAETKLTVVVYLECMDCAGTIFWGLCTRGAPIFKYVHPNEVGSDGNEPAISKVVLVVIDASHLGDTVDYVVNHLVAAAKSPALVGVDQPAHVYSPAYGTTMAYAPGDVPTHAIALVTSTTLARLVAGDTDSAIQLLRESLHDGRPTLLAVTDDRTSRLPPEEWERVAEFLQKTSALWLSVTDWSIQPISAAAPPPLDIDLPEPDRWFWAEPWKWEDVGNG